MTRSRGRLDMDDGWLLLGLAVLFIGTQVLWALTERRWGRTRDQVEDKARREADNVVAIHRAAEALKSRRSKMN